MRILVCYQYFGTPAGSWSTRIYEFCRRWVAEGHEVCVVTATYEKSDIRTERFIDRQQVDGIELIVINTPDSNRRSVGRRAVNAALFSLLASWFALTRRCDLVLCSSGPISIGLPGILAAIFRRRPFVFEVRDLWPAGGIEMGKIRGRMSIRTALWFEKQCYRNADLVVTASPGQYEHIRKRYPRRRYLVIPNAADIGLFRKADPGFTLPSHLQGRKLFLHIGSLGFIHNPMHWVAVAAALRNLDPEGRLAIVLLGEGSERLAMEAGARELGLTNLHFMGLRPKLELPGWLAASVATLFTTLDNPVQDTCSPNKVFDSLAAGVPVIQTTRGWLRDLMESESCGISVEPGDAEGMARKMLLLANDAHLRHRLSVQARRVAADKFNRDMLASRYLKALQDVLARYKQ